MNITIQYQSWMCFQPSKSDKSREWLPTNHRFSYELNELEDSHFPRAFNVKDERTVIKPGQDEYSAEMCVIMTPYRTDGGKLYIPFHEKTLSGIEKRIDVNYVSFKRYIEQTIENAFTGEKKDGSRCFQPGESIILKEDNNDEIQEFIRRKMSEFRYFDHKYWVETTEPRYMVLTYSFRKHGYTATSIVIRNEYSLNIPRDRYFNALDFDKAKALYESEVANGAFPSPIKVGISVKMKDMVRLPSGEAVQQMTVDEDASGQYSFNFAV